jgi:uncharacterized protein (DUF1810 family)
MFEHFVEAQSETYHEALAELAAGWKRSHWMWFIFPQLAGLGRSPMAQKFALKDVTEAKAYLDHPLLGARLREAVATVLPHATHASAHDIFGSPDDLKFCSSLTLFAQAAPEETLFRAALEAFYGGVEDEATVRLIQ